MGRGVERMNGFPVIYVPSELIDRATATGASGQVSDPQAAATYAAIKKMATNIRVDEQMDLFGFQIGAGRLWTHWSVFHSTAA